VAASKNPLTDTKVIKSALKSGERGYLPFPSPGRKAGYNRRKLEISY